MFAVSQKLAKLSTPTLYESVTIEKSYQEGEVFTVAGYKPFMKYIHTREWCQVERTEQGELINTGITLTDNELKRYDWRWTGHFNTYVGIPKGTRKKRTGSTNNNRGKNTSRTSSDQPAQSNDRKPGNSEIKCPF